MIAQRQIQVYQESGEQPPISCKLVFYQRPVTVLHQPLSSVRSCRYRRQPLETKIIENAKTSSGVNSRQLTWKWTCRNYYTLHTKTDSTYTLASFTDDSKPYDVFKVSVFLTKKRRPLPPLVFTKCRGQSQATRQIHNTEKFLESSTQGQQHCTN